MATNNRYLDGPSLIRKGMSRLAPKRTGILQDIGSSFMEWAKKRKQKGQKRAEEYMRTTGHYPG